MWENQIWNFLLDIISIKMFIAIVAIYFLIVWLTIIIWVIKDITSRSESLFFQFTSILTVIIFWPLWVLIYLLIRPNKTFFEKYYEEIEGNIEYLTDNVFKKLDLKKAQITQMDEVKKSKAKNKKKEKTKKIPTKKKAEKKSK